MQEEISLADETFLTDVVLKLAQERSFQVIYGLLLPVNKAPCQVWPRHRGINLSIWVILVNMVMSVILGHEKTKIQNILDLGKIDIFSDRTNIYIKNKKMGHLI